jgi:DNA-binding transcriptional LysR family regulator
MVEGLKSFGIDVPASLLRHRTDSSFVMWELARAGLGIGIFPAERALTDPAMEVLFDGEVAVRFPVWLVTHRELHSSRRIRMVYDHLADQLAAQLRRTANDFAARLR